MKHIIFLTLLILATGCRFNENKTDNTVDFSIGVITDCQYCDCPTKGVRYYKKSPERLKAAVKKLNSQDLAYTVHLGDFIDQNFSSFDTLIPIWNKLNSPSHHVLGNHDFSVADSLKKNIIKKLNLQKRYYSITKNNWKFLMLDGTDLSSYGSLDPKKQTEAVQLLQEISAQKKPYAQSYNGGLSQLQIDWVKQELIQARVSKLNVAFFCHFPVQPISNHNIWNTEEFMTLISNYPEVKLFMNGHNHAGAYSFLNGVHYITFKGMVDSENKSAFSIVRFTKDSLFIEGFGKEKNAQFKL